MFVPEPSRQPSPTAWGGGGRAGVCVAKTAKQMHYNEPKGNPRAEVEGESLCSAPVALPLLGLGSWRQ